MNEHLETNNLFNKNQCPQKFPTETFVAKMTNDLVLNLNTPKRKFFIRLDLSAAFDALEYELHLSISEISLGFKEKVHSFLNSYQSSKSQKVLIDVIYLMPRTITTAVRQG